MPLIRLRRHAEPRYEGLAFRDRDLAPLSQAGVGQAERSAERLLGADVVQVLSSPVTRALHTGALLAAHLRVPLVVDADLREWRPGAAASRSRIGWTSAIDDLREHHGEWPAGHRRAWEPMSAVRRRALAALERQPEHGADCVVVTHALVLEAIAGVDGRAIGYCEGVDVQVDEVADRASSAGPPFKAIPWCVHRGSPPAQPSTAPAAHPV